MHIIKLKVWNLLSEIFPKFVGKDISIYIYVCVCVFCISISVLLIVLNVSFMKKSSIKRSIVLLTTF